MSSGEDSGERNPFAPPPPGAPDQPWRPRVPPPPADGPGEQRPETDPWGRPQPEQPAGPKLDPADPTHRTARNALLSGFAALLAVLFGQLWIGFPLALLAVWYAVTVLRTPTEPVSDPFAPRPVRPQVPAALGALITGGLALLVSVGVFGMQFAYHDYLACVDSAATTEAAHSCAQEENVPAWVSALYMGPNE
ncbi:hypothetical protein [Streptomyces sp. TLI_171]|uniref:hypothetical protein n=1 Tax=Streptomyces sp. TLI_171 TaxID=1938859 RepID=UPI000C1A5DDF|nr:hypothetical protein [Streptomyces sp. TLI_171]RKE19470.1 hypothetical protein BX266_2792 [Streptomyces sp. TLI_171]